MNPIGIRQKFQNNPFLHLHDPRSRVEGTATDDDADDRDPHGELP